MISRGVEMYETGMLYEIGKQRMQEFIAEAERKRMLKTRDTISYWILMEKIRLNLSSDVECC